MSRCPPFLLTTKVCDCMQAPARSSRPSAAAAARCPPFLLPTQSYVMFAFARVGDKKGGQSQQSESVVDKKGGAVRTRWPTVNCGGAPQPQISKLSCAADEVRAFKAGR